MTERPNLPLIAIIGIDGSGKTTVCTTLVAWLNKTYPTKLCHLGKQTGNIGRKIAQLPLLGKKINKNIDKKANKSRSAEGSSGFVALVIFILSMKRVYRFYKMLALRKKGFLIITDRYPQTSFVGGLEGPELHTDNPKSLITKIITKWERKIYYKMTRHTPDLVIRLNVDIDTAMSRKPDHNRQNITRKIKSISQLTFNHAPIVDINTTEPLEDVLKQAREAITNILKKTNN